MSKPCSGPIMWATSTNGILTRIAEKHGHDCFETLHHVFLNFLSGKHSLQEVSEFGLSLNRLCQFYLMVTRNDLYLALKRCGSKVQVNCNYCNRCLSSNRVFAGYLHTSNWLHLITITIGSGCCGYSPENAMAKANFTLQYLRVEFLQDINGGLRCFSLPSNSA